MAAETNGRAWPRRAIAGAICGVWAAGKLGAVAASFVAGLSANGDALSAAAREIHGYAEATQTEMFVVLAFYFGGRHVDHLLGGLIERVRGAGTKPTP